MQDEDAILDVSFKKYKIDGIMANSDGVIDVHF